MKFFIALYQELAMGFHQFKYLLQLVRGKAVVARKTDRVEPELGFMVASFHMHMRRFISFAGIKVKSVAVFAQDGGHRSRNFCQPSSQITRTLNQVRLLPVINLASRVLIALTLPLDLWHAFSTPLIRPPT
jgi:hypothetical protein